MISEDDWKALESSAVGKAGAAWRRIHPDSVHDLYVAVRQPGLQRCLWYDFPGSAWHADAQVPRLRSVELSTTVWTDEPETVRCEMALSSHDLGDVFRALVTDVSGSIAATPDDEAGVAALLTRLERWRRLLAQEGNRGLSLEERRGLFGELSVLRALLEAHAIPEDTVAAWTGPYGRHQDFQMTAGAIEVKTTHSKQPQTLVIASERELDDTGVDRLILAHVSVDERNGGAGESLPDIISDVRSLLTDHPYAEGVLNESLLHAGYLEAHEALYAEPHYSIRKRTDFQVAEGFPRVIESMLPAGVGDVTYRIQLSALEPFAEEWEFVVTGLWGEA